MTRVAHKVLQASLRRGRVRAKVAGSAERPRLNVTISHLHVSAQLIDDSKGRTLAAATTVGSKEKGNLSQKSAYVGKQIAVSAKKAKITRVVFDRGSRQYAARLKALAESVRQEGIEV